MLRFCAVFWERTQVDQLTMVCGVMRYDPCRIPFSCAQNHKDWDHKTVLTVMKAQMLKVCIAYDPFQKAACVFSALPSVSYSV